VGSKLGYSTAARTLKCFRAHFYVPASGGAGARSFILDFGEGDVTSISTTNYTNDTNSSNEWYTLDGRRLQGKPAQKGVYVQNGRKMVIRYSYIPHPQPLPLEGRGAVAETSRNLSPTPLREGSSDGRPRATSPRPSKGRGWGWGKKTKERKQK